MTTAVLEKAGSVHNSHPKSPRFSCQPSSSPRGACLRALLSHPAAGSLQLQDAMALRADVSPYNQMRYETEGYGQVTSMM